jgi:hypothetical protein
MTMYVDILSAALEGENVGPSTREGLFAAAIACRARMLDSRRRRGDPAEQQLVCEVDYDRALINLCTALGIDAPTGQFAHPAGERSRLELALAAAGEDLAGTGGRGWPRPD